MFRDSKDDKFREAALTAKAPLLMARDGDLTRLQKPSAQIVTSPSNSFTNLSPVVVLRGNYLASTNYLDIGGATNMPSKFYRVRLGP